MGGGGREGGGAVYSFMTEINEESRYTAGESRQLRRNERNVLIVLG